MKGIIQRALNAIIRPPRKNYDISSLPLHLVTDNGDSDDMFIRRPMRVENTRGDIIMGSLYYLSDMDPNQGGPCVIYLHGNASCQLEGQFLVPNLCPHHIFVFCFDFIGCGESTGQYVSLGFFEEKDTTEIIELLHESFGLGPFILWGRSMGAATSLLVENQNVVGRVVDSAFTSVKDLCSSIAKNMSLPSLFVPTAIWYLKNKIIETAQFDFSQVSPIKSVKNTNIPVVFGHAENDDFIPLEHCRHLYNQYSSNQKCLMVLPGGHNSKRPGSWIHVGVSFCLKTLQIPVKILVISECRSLQSSEAHFQSFSELVKGGSGSDDPSDSLFRTPSDAMFNLSVGQNNDEEEDDEFLAPDDTSSKPIKAGDFQSANPSSGLSCITNAKISDFNLLPIEAPNTSHEDYEIFLSVKSIYQQRRLSFGHVRKRKLGRGKLKPMLSVGAFNHKLPETNSTTNIFNVVSYNPPINQSSPLFTLPPEIPAEPSPIIPDETTPLSPLIQEIPENKSEKKRVKKKISKEKTPPKKTKQPQKVSPKKKCPLKITKPTVFEILPCVPTLKLETNKICHIPDVSPKKKIIRKASASNDDIKDKATQKKVIRKK